MSSHNNSSTSAANNPSQPSAAKPFTPLLVAPHDLRVDYSGFLTVICAVVGIMFRGAPGETDPNNTTIFVGGLDESVTYDQMKQAFGLYGELVHVKIHVRKHCSFVQFSQRANAEVALQQLNDTQLGGQSIRLSWGRSTSNNQAQPDQSQWNAAAPYYGYSQGYESYGFAPPQPDASMYYAAYPNGYGSYQQQPQTQPQQQLQMDTLQSRLDAEFLLAHMCSGKFKEWIVVLATLLRRYEVYFGVEKYETINEQFDPNRHNAIYQIPDASNEPDTVAAVLKMMTSASGDYLLNDASLGNTRFEPYNVHHGRTKQLDLGRIQHLCLFSVLRTMSVNNMLLDDVMLNKFGKQFAY